MIIIIRIIIINSLTELFSGQTEVMCKTTAQADIILLVDGSWSIGRLNFKTIRSFIARMVGVFDIGPDRVQIGKRIYPEPHISEKIHNSAMRRKSLEFSFKSHVSQTFLLRKTPLSSHMCALEFQKISQQCLKL